MTNDNAFTFDLHHPTQVADIIYDGKEYPTGELFTITNMVHLNYHEFKKLLFPELVKCVLTKVNVHKTLHKTLPPDHIASFMGDTPPVICTYEGKITTGQKLSAGAGAENRSISKIEMKDVCMYENCSNVASKYAVCDACMTYLE